MLVGPLALPPTPCSERVGGFVFTCFLVFRGFGAFWRASLHAISRDSDDSGPMGKALFTLFAVFGPLFGQGAGEPYFAGRGGPFLHAPARTNYRSPPKVRAWRALLKGLQGAVFYRGLALWGEEGQFTRYFTCDR